MDGIQSDATSGSEGLESEVDRTSLDGFENPERFGIVDYSNALLSLDDQCARRWRPVILESLMWGRLGC